MKTPAQLQQSVKQHLSACERGDQGISYHLPHALPGDFQAPQGGLVGRRGKVCSKGWQGWSGGARAEPMPYLTPPGMLRAGLPMAPCPTRQSPVPPRLLLFAGCGLQHPGQSSSRRMAISVQPQPASSPRASPPQPRSPLLLLSPGAWAMESFVEEFQLGSPVASTQFLTKYYED